MSKAASSTGKTPFKTILNFRDVAASINTSAGDSILQEGLLYRSARPGSNPASNDESSKLTHGKDHVSEDEAPKLVDIYGIKSVIDLRTETEVLQQQTKATGAQIDLSSRLRDLGINYYNISLNGRGYSQALVQRLSWLQYIKLVALMVTGYRTQGIAVLGESVMQDRGLLGLANDTLEASGAEIKAIFTLLAEQCNYSVLVHCTQGKDRTGLIAALLLFVLHVPSDAIDADYTLSDVELESEREGRLAEVHAIGLGDEFAWCAPGFVASVLQHLKAAHGSVDGYLDGIGVDRSVRESIRSLLLWRHGP